MQCKYIPLRQKYNNDWKLNESETSILLSLVHNGIDNSKLLDCSKTVGGSMGQLDRSWRHGRIRVIEGAGNYAISSLRYRGSDIGMTSNESIKRGLREFAGGRSMRKS